MIATRTIRIQLKPTPEQVALLRQTLQEYTNSFNAVCQIADAQKVRNGVDVAFVDARYSSQACSKCGYIDKRNRVCQSEFSCKNRQCGYQLNADYNAALNLASRAKSVAGGPFVKGPIVSDLRV